MKKILICVSIFFACSTAQAATVFFNSPTNADNPATYSAWLSAIGISAPQFLEDFEDTGQFIAGTDINGVSGVLPAGLVVTQSSSGMVEVVSGSGSIGGGNPLGNQAVVMDQFPLVFDFSANPIDYFGVFTMDHVGANDGFSVTYTTNGFDNNDISNTLSSGESAEFIGVYTDDQLIKQVRIAVANGSGLWGMDNIQFGLAAVVPVPATFWLFGSALGLLGWLKRQT